MGETEEGWGSHDRREVVSKLNHSISIPIRRNNRERPAGSGNTREISGRDELGRDPVKYGDGL